MKEARQIISLWLPVAVWCGLIFYLSSLPSPPPTGNPFFDVVLPNLAHLLEYGLLLTLTYRASQKPLFAFLFAFFYAFLDEFHQSFVATRTASFSDILVDTLGMALAWFVIWKLLPKAPKKLNLWAKKWQLV